MSMIEMKIEVSDLNGVKGYGFAFDGKPIVMSRRKGTFSTPQGEEKILEWIMKGNPSGTMKVVVSRADVAKYTRNTSTIAPPFGEGFDAFKILEN
jgi:hypothetical protein